MGGTATIAPAAEQTDRGPRERRLRADAHRNRDRIVAAAREVFVEHGPDVPLDEIARRAGVGNATLYRHFADRSDLVREVVATVLARSAEHADAAAEQESGAYQALRQFVHAAADERVGAICPILSDRVDKTDAMIDAARQHLQTAVDRLIGRAQAAGEVRGDVTSSDVFIAMTQLTRPLPGTTCGAIDRYSHRYLEIFLDGLRTPPRSELPGSPATFEELQRECDLNAQRLNAQRRCGTKHTATSGRRSPAM